jgi:dephospho-CoA kinase
VRAIMATQASRDERLAVADDVISNSGGLATLGPQIDVLHQRYLGLATLRLNADTLNENC